MENLLIVVCLLQLILIILIVAFRPKASSPEAGMLRAKIDSLDQAIGRLEINIRNEFKDNRQEISTIAKDNRAELSGALRELRSELINSLRERFSALEEKQSSLVSSTEKKLDQIRETVDEKLSKTLNERLGQSFEQVSKHLESVQKGIGEMQTLAQDVGGLKKVLSNVKIRGGMGEVQLAMLLEQILAPGQYDSNVRTKQNSTDTVEFAIKLPGRDEQEKNFVYLPIDAKFPKDAYETLINAYENAIPDDIDAATKNLESTIRKMAKDIRDKYIDPPHTTDFALMFLPFEGIYAEVIRRSALIDQLQNEYKVAVAGPTTLAAYLNSLQMGFRTLAIQKRSGEVWQVLASVKTEFSRFGGLLEKTKKNLTTATSTVDELLGTRTKAINRRLKDVESGAPEPLPGIEALLPGEIPDDENEES